MHGAANFWNHEYSWMTVQLINFFFCQYLGGYSPGDQESRWPLQVGRYLTRYFGVEAPRFSLSMRFRMQCPCIFWSFRGILKTRVPRPCMVFLSIPYNLYYFSTWNYSKINNNLNVVAPKLLGTHSLLSFWAEVFVYFEFEIRFAPQRRAPFQHGHFVLPFSLRNVLCATTACSVSIPQFPKKVGRLCILPIFASTCLSRQWRRFFQYLNIQKRSRFHTVLILHVQICFAPSILWDFSPLKFFLTVFVCSRILFEGVCL